MVNVAGFMIAFTRGEGDWSKVSFPRLGKQDAQQFELEVG